MPTEVRLRRVGEKSGLVEIDTASFPAASNDGQKAKPSYLRGQNIIYVPLRFSESASSGSFQFELELDFQACDDRSCFAPTRVKRKLDLKLVSADEIRQGCSAPELFARWSDRRSGKPASRTGGFDYKSKEPPIGPPWVRDLPTAQALALKTGRPIFLYSTKTFCPHCVIVESELLSSPKLQPSYDKVIWLYVYRDFKDGEADRAARRIGDRYSLSSWPQLWLIDPGDLKTIAETGRTVESFTQAIGNVNIQPTSDTTALKALRESEQRVHEFERNPTLESALTLLRSDDVVGKVSAARYLAEQQQLQALADQARELLEIPNDVLRIETLKAIAATGVSDVQPMVTALVENPQPSRNFNVLRSQAIQALAVCGDVESVSIIAPHALGTARNSTSRIAVKAMVQLAERHPESRRAVVAALAQSFPPIETGMERLVTSHAQLVHDHLAKLTGAEIPFPKAYTAESRLSLIEAWSSEVTQ